MECEHARARARERSLRPLATDETEEVACGLVTAVRPVDDHERLADHTLVSHLGFASIIQVCTEDDARLVVIDIEANEEEFGPDDRTSSSHSVRTASGSDAVSTW
jgi:hypothetical protein